MDAAHAVPSKIHNHSVAGSPGAELMSLSQPSKPLLPRCMQFFEVNDSCKLSQGDHQLMTRKTGIRTLTGGQGALTNLDHASVAQGETEEIVRDNRLQGSIVHLVTFLHSKSVLFFMILRLIRFRLTSLCCSNCFSPVSRWCRKAATKTKGSQ